MRGFKITIYFWSYVTVQLRYNCFIMQFECVRILIQTLTDFGTVYFFHASRSLEPHTTPQVQR